MKTFSELDSPPGPEGWQGLAEHRRYRHSGSALRAEWISAFLAGAGLRVRGGDPRLLEMNAIRFDAFFVAHVRSQALSVEWLRQRASAQTRYMLVFVNHGSVVVEGAAGQRVSPGRGICIVSPGRGSVIIRSSADCEGILFTFDRREIAPYALTPSNIGDIDPDAGVFRAGYACLYGLVSRSPVSDEQTDVLRDLTQAVARALTRASVADKRSGTAVWSAQQVVEQCSRDPDFDVDELAARSSVSRRTLGRLYERHGLSPAREIRRSRAQRALLLIRDHHTMPLEDVATASGFRSLSTMDRTLMTVYGLSARAIRREDGARLT
ncbi:helix-turn-helix domain-containing protein [Microbacterium sp. NPDC089321]|uniref:AraC family transcriptional regulator n=1 Tax=Microbacterium sp. NPDC089321 TaxID=3155183 RepID=UPI0034357465